MTRRRVRTWTVSGLVLAGVLAATAVLCVLSRAQAQPQPGQPPFGGPGGAGGFPPRMAMMQPAAICATADFVYVVRGNTLYQFEAKELQLVKKVMLEEERPFPPPGRPGGEGRPPGERE